MQSSVAIKVQFNGQFRRFALPSYSFEALEQQIRSLFEISEAREVKVQYRDDEGDNITILTDEELKAAAIASAGCLKLIVTVIGDMAVVAEVSEPKVLNTSDLKASDEHQRKPRNQMPEFVREIIKQKQAKKNEKAAKTVDEGKDRQPSLRARLLVSSDAPDCQELVQDAPFIQTWKLRNVGTLPWSTEVNLVRVSKEALSMSTVDSMAITRDVAPGDDYEVAIPMRAPNQLGSYESSWKFVDKDGKKFGPKLNCKINVVAPQPNPVEVESSTAKKEKGIVGHNQARQERLKQYEVELTKLRELGFKPNNQHLKLLVEYNGDIDRVVAFFAQKKAQAKS